MDKERKSRGRNGAGISLRMQFGILFFLMMIGTILLGYLINGLFLEKYYVSVRTSDLVRVYDMLLTAEKQDLLDSDEFDETLMTSGEMKVLLFEGYTEQWADFIFANRKRQKPPFVHDYDIVYGPIANDNVGEQVALFKGGYISKERFLQKLKNMRGITFQYAFCTEASISKLKKL